MLKSFRRLFAIYKGYRGRLIFSQVLLFIAALSMIGVATLTQRLINDGIGAADETVIVQTGFWMIVLAVIAGTAYYAVFFAQGTAYVLRVELYNKLQTFSFGNFDRFRTGNVEGNWHFEQSEKSSASDLNNRGQQKISRRRSHLKTQLSNFHN